MAADTDVEGDGDDGKLRWLGEVVERRDGEGMESDTIRELRGWPARYRPGLR